MKRLLFAILLMAGCAHGDELQLDHSFGPTPSEYAMSFSPNGEKLAVAGTEGVIVYQTATGRVLEAHAASGIETRSVAWSPDGQSLAAGGLNYGDRPRGEIWLWRQGQKPLRWNAGLAAVHALAWSPSGKILASAGGGNSLSGYSEDNPLGGYGEDSAFLWDAGNGKLSHTLGHYRSIGASIVFSSDGKRIAFSIRSFRRGDARTTLCDVATGRSLKTWYGYSPVPLFLNNQNPILDNQWWARTFKAGYELFIDNVYGVPGHYNRRYLFTARKIGSKVEAVHIDLGHGGECAAFGGDYIAVLERRDEPSETGALVSIWKISGIPPRAHFVRELGQHTLSPSQIAISADTHKLAVVTRSGTGIFDATFSQPQFLFNANSVGPIPYRTFQPQGGGDVLTPTLALARDGIRLFDGRWFDLTPAIPKELKWHAQRDYFEPQGAALSPNGLSLVGANSGSDLLKRVGAPDVTLKRPSLDGAGENEDLSESFDFTAAAWASDGGKVALIGRALDSDGDYLVQFDANGKFEREIKSPNPLTRWSAVAFSPDGRKIVTVGIFRDNAPFLRVWDAARSKQEMEIKWGGQVNPDSNAAGEFSSIAFSPDGQTIGVGGHVEEKGIDLPTLAFYDAESGALTGRLPLLIAVDKSWVFLDSRHVAILNGNAIDVWDFRAHKLEKSEFMVPKPGGFDFVERH